MLALGNRLRDKIPDCLYRYMQFLGRLAARPVAVIAEEVAVVGNVDLNVVATSRVLGA
jgi:hypothetical protein